MRSLLLSLAATALVGLSTQASAQTIGCEIGGPGGLVPSTGNGGGGTFPGTLPTVTTSFPLNVASLPPGATSVSEVKLNGLTHSWLADVQVVLTDPSGVSHNLWVRGPSGITSCDWNGNYVIVPECAGLGQTPPTSCTGTAVLAPGAYDQFFGAGTTLWPTGTNNIFNTPLNSIAAATGVWTLTFYDWAAGDAGALGSWDLCFGTPIAQNAPSVAPALTSPAANANVNGPFVNLSWGAVACATSYEVDVDGTIYAVPGTTYQFQSTAGVHNWTARGVNGSGSGPWAASRAFTDNGPAAPTLLTPAAGASLFGPNVNFTWNALTNVSSYDIDIDGTIYNTLTNSFAITNSVAGNHSWTVRGNWLGNTISGPWATARTYTDLGVPPPLPNGKIVVGNDQSGVATIYEIDVNTGVATAIYSSSTVDGKPWGLAYDPSTNTLYWNNGSALYSSPYANPLVPTSLGAITFNSAAITCVSLSFYNGKLYATRNIATEAVYEIDPVTLVATQVYVYSSSFDIGGLEHDAVTGQLFGLTDAAPSPAVRGLYELDIAAQTATFRAPYPAGETDIDALAVAGGFAFYVSDGPNTTQANFYVYNIIAGTLVGTLPSPFTGSGTFSAATFIGDGNGTPVTYCTAGTTTNGCTADIAASANPSVSFAHPCNITVTDVEGQKSGLIFYSITGPHAGVWNATSFLCVKSPTQRTGTQTSGGTVDVCDGTLSLDWNAYQASHPTALGQPWSAGNSAQVQAWFRDPPAGKATNLSNAVELTYVP